MNAGDFLLAATEQLHLAPSAKVGTYGPLMSCPVMALLGHRIFDARALLGECSGMAGGGT